MPRPAAREKKKGKNIRMKKIEIGELMQRSLLLPCITLILIFANSNVCSDSLSVHYIFWSPAKYSLNNGEKEKVGSDFAFGFYRPDFKKMFQDGKESYKHMKKSERKKIIGNFAFAAPAGVMLGLGLVDIFPNGNFLSPTGKGICWGGGIALCIADISIGVSGFKDLRIAVQKWNAGE